VLDVGVDVLVDVGEDLLHLLGHLAQVGLNLGVALRADAEGGRGRGGRRLGRLGRRLRTAGDQRE